MNKRSFYSIILSGAILLSSSLTYTRTDESYKKNVGRVALGTFGAIAAVVLAVGGGMLIKLILQDGETGFLKEIASLFPTVPTTSLLNYAVDSIVVTSTIGGAGALGYLAKSNSSDGAYSIYCKFRGKNKAPQVTTAQSSKKPDFSFIQESNESIVRKEHAQPQELYTPGNLHERDRNIKPIDLFGKSSQK